MSASERKGTLATGRDAMGSCTFLNWMVLPDTVTLYAPAPMTVAWLLCSWVCRI